MCTYLEGEVCHIHILLIGLSTLLSNKVVLSLEGTYIFSICQITCQLTYIVISSNKCYLTKQRCFNGHNSGDEF